METRHSGNRPTGRLAQPVLLPSSLALAILVALVGCGAPGEPVPPSPPVPVAITDLSVHQSGDGVKLTFTMPAKTIAGDRLAQPPSVEVLRGSLKPDGSPDVKSFRVVYTIPGSLVGNYRTEDRVQFVDPVAPDDTRAHPGVPFAYRVQTRASAKRASAPSNTVIVRVFPVPERIASLQAKLTETAVELTWTAPARSSAGDPLAPVAEYRLFRGEIDPKTYDPSTRDLSKIKWIAPLAQIADLDATSYRDTQFDFGKTYIYMVRSILNAGGSDLESDDSNLLTLDAVDTFPPSVPQGVVAAVTSATPSGPPEVDLSWSINVETDLAGYRVYRSESPDNQGQLITADPLLSPAYRDTSVRPDGRYWYRITAVDRSGNESAPSPPVVADVAQHSS
jgi:hypothetical protein